MRDELLACEVFATRLDAKVLTEDFRVGFNRNRPHSTLGNQPPAKFAAQRNSVSQDPPQGLALQTGFRSHPTPPRCRSRHQLPGDDLGLAHHEDGCLLFLVGRLAVAQQQPADGGAQLGAHLLLDGPVGFPSRRTIAMSSWASRRNVSSPGSATAESSVWFWASMSTTPEPAIAPLLLQRL